MYKKYLTARQMPHLSLLKETVLELDDVGGVGVTDSVFSNEPMIEIEQENDGEAVHGPCSVTLNRVCRGPLTNIHSCSSHSYFFLSLNNFAM